MAFFMEEMSVRDMELALEKSCNSYMIFLHQKITF